jgi:hypothetical protein
MLRLRRSPPSFLGPLLALGLLLGSGCDQEEAPVVESADLRKQELEARCDYLVRCGFMPDEDTCRASQTYDQSVVQALGGTSFGRSRYDEEAAANWLATLRELGCEATAENARLYAEARAPVFAGRIEVGGSCFADDECEDDAVCDRAACQGDQICCTGECVEQRVLGVGERCPLPQQGVRLTAACEESAYCQLPPDDGSGVPPTEGTCQVRSDNGLPCDQVDGCLDGQRCDQGGTGNCYKLSARGEQCNPDLQRGSCIGIFDVCSPSSSECVLAPGSGEACVLGQCAGWATCQDDGTGNTMCVALPRAGEACDGGLPCLGDLGCRDGVCQLTSTVLVCVEGDPPPPPMEM